MIIVFAIVGIGTTALVVIGVFCSLIDWVRDTNAGLTRVDARSIENERLIKRMDRDVDRLRIRMDLLDGRLESLEGDGAKNEPV